MTSSLLSAENIRGRLEITLNRPEKRNALTPAMLFELAEIVTSPGSAHLIVLRSSLAAGFSAGFDLGVLREFGPSAHDGDPIGTAVSALVHSPVPTVAVLNGYCVGAAVELVAACDLRIARRDLRLLVPANRLGSPYRPAGVDLLARRFGWVTSVELLVFGTTLDADGALLCRFVAMTGEDADLSRYVDAVDERLSNSPIAAVHRTMLADWSERPPADADFLDRWERARAEAVAARQIPPARDPDRRSATSA